MAMVETIAMQPQGYDFGMVGLGVMGRNMLLNVLDHGYSTAGLDTDVGKTEAFLHEANGNEADAATDSKAFVAMLRKPRVIMLLVPAGAPVDAVISELLPRLSPGDLLIDGGNSHFRDTNRRGTELASKNIHFFGMGVSGGQSGARHGPSMMPGGPNDAYERVRPILEAIAAKVGGDPCVAYLGQGSAGHYVKMVHNGIEYALMQLISETYDLMKRGMGLSNEQLAEVYHNWNTGELNGFLIEITSQIFRRRDDNTGKSLIDLILDVAQQKGTGQWTSQDALNLGIPTPTLDVAVAMRNLSARETPRRVANKVLQGPQPEGRLFPASVNQVHDALYAGMIICYAQGMSQLQEASRVYSYNLNIETIARIWRGGCIIRAAMLENVRAAYQSNPELPELMLDPYMAHKLNALQSALRTTVRMGVESGIPVSGHMACLTYFDAFRSGWMPFNLIQAQRDFFGAHTYERNDAKGVFHTNWSND